MNARMLRFALGWFVHCPALALKPARRWTLLAVMFFPDGVRAAPERNYVLDAGDAVTTLRQFVEQSGEQVVYFVSNVRGVNTHAVVGSLPASVALERMLAGTDLIAEQDERTGAFAIRRKSAKARDLAGSGQRPVVLFDGTTLAGWHSPGQADPTGWKITDGILTWQPHAGDLVSDRDYGDFELEIEWKAARANKVNVAFRAHPGATDPAAQRGWEYALAEFDSGGRRENEGSGKMALPAGEWNVSRLIVRGSQVELWLNSTRVKKVDAEFSQPAAIGENGSRSFAKAFPPSRGAIVLRDDGAPVWFRRIILRPLESAP